MTAERAPTSRPRVAVTAYEPSLALHRREWTPAAAVGLAGSWVGAVVTDGEGNRYWGVRGCDDFVPGMTHVVSPICGFKRLPDSLDGEPVHLFEEYSALDWFEPLQYSDSGDVVQLTYPSGRITRDANTFAWSDGCGRWHLQGRTISDIAITHVPAQAGVDGEVYYRHELMHVSGTVGGRSVSGYAHQDFAYGPPGAIYTELAIAQLYQGMWVSWLHEESDGQLSGGSFWQGRTGIDFGPGYRVDDGITIVCENVSTTPRFNESGRIVELTVRMDQRRFDFEFDTSGSPLHVFGSLTGRATGGSGGRSWCWVEYTGDLMTPELLDAANSVYALARRA